MSDHAQSGDYDYRSREPAPSPRKDRLGSEDVPPTYWEDTAQDLEHRLAAAERERDEAERLLRLTCEHTCGTPVSEQSRELADISLGIESCHERVERELKIMQLKNKNSLANNLCPDHRDKQVGKPCLACTIETAVRERDAALERVKELEGR